MARIRTVAAAVVRRAQMRATLDDLSRNPDPRLAGVVAAVLASAARILRDAAGLRRVRLVLWREPVGGPLPDVADHVVHAVAVWRECRHRRGTLEAVLVEVLSREFALPGVRHVPAAGRELIAPRKLRAVEPAARGVFPLGFGRQCLTGPCGVGLRIGKRHMHDRMVVERVDATLWAGGMAPVRALHELPPF